MLDLKFNTITEKIAWMIWLEVLARLQIICMSIDKMNEYNLTAIKNCK